ncbi:hypothetical protein GCK72_010837 [Caenorhabditis remanei]|uniref:Uncharacterized protein n=1 Tax=Caenorhabditis remanei TaxID=31234 RepID=A0A6A5H665_CAERE|nr:hypothetical protein GCK72_010837 [Caenorhabditis remanei]KAF1762575.1 hypothetical protein GCK72_010837 [Caenorhabditis remanei]
MRLTLILIWIVVFSGLPSLVISSDFSSNATKTLVPQMTIVEMIETYTVETIKNETKKEKKPTLAYKIMNMGSENSWRGLLYGVRTKNKTLRVKISNIIPTYYLFQSCNQTFWQSNGPIETAVIDFTMPWIQYLWKLLRTCDPKNQFFVFTAVDNSTFSIKSDAHVDLFEYNTTHTPKETDHITNEVRIRGRNNSLFDVRINGMIARALQSNGTSEIRIAATGSPLAIHFQLVKCDLLFNFTLKIRPNEMLVVDEKLLNVFNMLKHTYCSNGTEDDLSFQLLLNWPPRAITKSIKFVLSPTIPSLIYVRRTNSSGDEDDMALFWYGVSLTLVFLCLSATILLLALLYHMSSKKAEYFVTTEPVVAYRRRQPIIQKRLFKRSIVVIERPSDVESPCDTESPDDNEY